MTHYISPSILIMFALFLQGCQFLAKPTSMNDNNHSDQVVISQNKKFITFNSQFNQSEIESIRLAYRKAQKQLMTIFGDTNSSDLKVNICHVNECTSSFFNVNKRLNFSYSNNLTSELLSAWIVLEINQRQGRSRKTNIPTWFTYGFAAAASEDERFLEKHYLSHIILPPAVNIFDLDSDAKWRWAQKKYQHYPFDIVTLIATQEVRSWYQYSDGFPISRLIKEVNFGADFDLVYQHLSDIYSAIVIK